MIYHGENKEKPGAHKKQKK